MAPAVAAAAEAGPNFEVHLAEGRLSVTIATGTPHEALCGLALLRSRAARGLLARLARDDADAEIRAASPRLLAAQGAPLPRATLDAARPGPPGQGHAAALDRRPAELTP